MPKAGLQLYTVRSILQDDFEGTIRKIAEIGYREVELHDLFDYTPTRVRAILEGAGLTAPARHVGLADLRARIEEVMDESKTLGCRWIVCPFIALHERTLDAYRKVADELNAAAQACQEAGLSFAYHNHNFEFEPVDGIVPYDLLLEGTDGDRVAMELDIYWMTKGGANPLAYFDRYPGRFPLFHVKDMAADGSMTEIASGNIDFATIFASAEKAGLRHCFVEHDHPDDPIASIAASYQGLAPLLDAVWPL
jgi:sugar phosphate isomerase/epimerase